MTLDEIRKVILESKPITSEQIVKEIQTCKEEFNDDNIKRLALLIQIISLRSLHEHLHSLLDVALSYEKEKLDDNQTCHVLYALSSIYYLLGFPPKTVEYGEKYLLIPNTNYSQAMIIYNYLTFIYKTYGYYEKAITYSNKALECAIKSKSVDFTAINILTHLNNMFIYISLNDSEKVKYEYQAFLDVKNNNLENPYVAIFNFSIELSAIYYDLYFDQSYDNFIRYINHMKKLDLNSMYIQENVDSHLDILKKMFDLGMYQNCLDITRILFNNNFIGDKLDIYQYYLSCYEKTNCDNIEEYQKVQNLYISQLKLIKQNYYSFTNLLIDEQLNYLKYMNDYEMMKEKFELDALTSCLNRPSFEQHFDSFIKDNPNGCLVFLDLDHLKKINDFYGHKIGDDYLRTFVKYIKKHLDERMTLYRYAGDEFIILSENNFDVSSIILDEVYNDFVTNASIPEIDASINDYRLSFSYGISSFHNLDNIDDIIHAADRIMYEYKKKHHNERK